jgi:hypothetical protein
VRDAAHAIPDAAARGNAGWGADARLIVWALAWDVHALVTQPLRLFDANIFHPAPGMLAGAENLLATALAVAPVQLASRNPVLAANVAAMATYPLAAVLRYALARALGLPLARRPSAPRPSPPGCSGSRASRGAPAAPTGSSPSCSSPRLRRAPPEPHARARSSAPCC